MEKIFELGPKIKERELKEKIERLMPVFERSLNEGIPVRITRKFEGKVQEIKDFAVEDFDEDGPLLYNIYNVDEEGDPFYTETMLWTEIIDAEIDE